VEENACGGENEEKGNENLYSISAGHLLGGEIGVQQKAVNSQPTVSWDAGKS